MSTTFAATAASATASTVKQTVGAQVVTKTLDVMNKTAPSKGKGKYKAGGDMAASYDFNKSVLSAVYSPKGAIASMRT